MRSLRPIKNRAAPINPALGHTDATGVPISSKMAVAAGSAQQLINQWDRSNKTQRIELLARFIDRHQESTAAELEQSLGSAASLFFTRILTWMRLTYQLGFELSVQLSALSLFLQGQRFLSTFAEVGGIEMVTDILCYISPERVEDRQNALVLLIHLANSGRVYRELVCDSDGVDHIIRAALNEKDSKTLEFYTSLFLALGQGNPRKASLVHVGLLELTRHGCDESALCAASVLRALQLAREQAAAPQQPMMLTALPPINSRGGPSMPAAPPGGGSALANVPMVGVDPTSPESVQRVLDTLFHLLRSDNVKLRYEGVELLSLASKSLALVVPVLDRCLLALDEAPPQPTKPPLLPALGSTSAGPSTLKGQSSALIPSELPAASDLKELRAKAQLRRLQLSCGRALCSILLKPAEDARLRLYRYFESKSGHMSLVKYLNLCDSRNDTAIEEVCNALRLLAYVPAVNEGYYAIDKIIDKSRTAAFMATILGKDLLWKVLEGPEMTREQVLALYKALKRDSQRGMVSVKGARKGSKASEISADDEYLSDDEPAVAVSPQPGEIQFSELQQSVDP